MAQGYALTLPILGESCVCVCALATWLAALVLGTIGLIDVADAQEQRIAVPAPPFDERIFERIPVAGELFAGIVGITAARQGSSGLGEPLSRLHLLVPGAKAQDEICLDVISRDGHYRAKNSFRVPSAERSETVRVQYPTKHAELFRTAGTNDFGFLARPGDCNLPSPVGLYLLAIMAATSEAPLEAVAILVNAGRDDVLVFSRYGDGPEEMSQCVRIRDGAHMAFDSECRLPAPAAGSTGDLVARFNIMRYRRLYRSEQITVRLQP